MSALQPLLVAAAVLAVQALSVQAGKGAAAATAGLLTLVPSLHRALYASQPFICKCQGRQRRCQASAVMGGGCAAGGNRGCGRRRPHGMSGRGVYRRNCTCASLTVPISGSWVQIVPTSAIGRQ